MMTPWTRYAIAVLALASYSAVVAQSLTVDSYGRCVGNSSAFAKDENLNEVVAEYLAKIQREIDSSVETSRVAEMAGLEERSKQARSRVFQHRQELQQACAQLSQSMNKADQRPKADQIAPAYGTQTEERARQANFELELSRRMPGATFVVNEAGFSQWLDSKQGNSLRRDLWEQAKLANDFERAVQILRDYEREPKPK